MQQFKVGDPIFGGTLVLVSISDDYRHFGAALPAVNNVGWPTISINFDSNQTVEDINALLK